MRLPVLGLGCWAFGGGAYWGPQSQKDVDGVVRHAVEHGCNFFDTAELYNDGASEESLGRALRGIPRERVLIATKVGPQNTEPKTLAEHFEASLRRLQTDYADIYYVHWPITAHAIRSFTAQNMPVPSVHEVFEALGRLQREGKIRFIGVSNFGPAKLREAVATGVQIVVNQLPYSLLTRAIELEILPLCRELGIGVVGYMALMQGVLADTYSALADLPPQRRRTRQFDSRRTPQSRHRLDGAEEETETALREIRRIAQRCGMSMLEVALKWSIAGAGMTSSLCGSRTVSQIQANIKAATGSLPEGAITELNRVTQPLLDKLGPSFDYFEHPDNDRTK